MAIDRAGFDDQPLVPLWELERGRFNHQTVRHGTIVTIDSALAQACEAVVNVDYLQAVVSDDLLQWLAHREIALDLIQRFEAEMSPAVLMNDDFFPNLPEDDRECAREILDLLWRDRHPIDYWVQNARAAVDRVDAALAVLVAEPVKGEGGLVSANFRNALLQLRESVETLVAAFSRFPHRILIG